jgi:S1-C subfamily serine protease
MTYGENSGYGGSGPFPMNSKRIWENNFIQNYISFMANFIVPNSSELKILSSGTCFAVNENGFLITNYHVVENAKKISVRGINNEFNNTIIANVIAIDKNNDLALLKLTDTIYQGFFSSIPYILSQNKCDVGESVYSLGFPLRSTMGDEVKLNNGIISSNSGFNGDVTCYQTSVPVQPGNSGGPLFNISGEIIGIINAKHKGAENVSYAVKKDYMRIFLDNSNVNFKRVASTNLKKMDLVNQFKEVKKFVFIVEVEN